MNVTLPERTARWWWFGLTGLGLAGFLLPIRWPGWFATPLCAGMPAAEWAVRALILGAVPAAAWLALRGTQLASGEKRGAWFLALVAAGVAEVIHHGVVDHGHYFGPAYFADNTAWQLALHRKVMSLDPAALPHSYRFLPDSIETVFTWLSGSFLFSRSAYRWLFETLWFVAAYRYARVYLSTVYAGGVVLVLAALYPLSILNYAGQPIDPASHLTFAVCLYALARNYETAFGPSLLVGMFCKESIVVLPLCRAFASGPRRRALLLSAAYLAGAIAVAFAIRYGVGHRVSSAMINRVHPGHMRANLAAYREWLPLYLAMLGILLPGAVLGWRLMDRAFHAACLILPATLFVSSLRYSWLAELRNLVPALLPLAVVNLRYLENLFGSPPAAPAASGALPLDGATLPGRGQ